MTDDHMPSAKLDPKLLHKINGKQLIDLSYKFPELTQEARVASIDDRDLYSTSMLTYKYGHRIILNDAGVYYLNRLHHYYEDNKYGPRQFGFNDHIYSMMKTYPILQELWDQFEATLILCGGHDETLKGKL